MAGTAAVQKGAKKKAPKVQTQQQQPLSTEPVREVIYPTIITKYMWAGAVGPESVNSEGKPYGPIGEEFAKLLLGWETEGHYYKRRCEEDGVGYDVSAIQQQYKDEFEGKWLLEDLEGNKVICHNNLANRPFTEAHAKKLAQDVLNRNWAGPTTLPGETVNCETMIITRTGCCASCQHRLIAEVFACQLYRKQKDHWVGKWGDKEPVIESIVIFGCSDNPKVIGTIDNTRPRDFGDTLYTSPILRDYKVKVPNAIDPSKPKFRPLDRTERKEMTRMLARAVQMLWKRTRNPKDTSNEYTKYATHTESGIFLEHHPRLEECLTKIFELNSERAISKLRLSPGHCAAIMYLMGSSDSDGDVYRNPKGSDIPSEKSLSWKNWDATVEFWTKCAKMPPEFICLSYALGSLVDADTGASGRLTEKFATLVKAWYTFMDGEELTFDTSKPKNKGNLSLENDYVLNSDGNITLKDAGDFGGIDLGERIELGSNAVNITPEELAQRAAAVKERSLAATRDVERAAEKARKINLEGLKEAAARAKEAKEKKETSKDIRAAQTEKARKHDEEDRFVKQALEQAQSDMEADNPEFEEEE